MKFASLYFLLLLWAVEVLGQGYSQQHEWQTVIQQRTIYLNGGARASMGGKSRVAIPIQLPQGTISWYYSFSTSPGESGTENLNLLLQLSALTVEPSGITGAAVKNIRIPQGSQSIDVYLLDQQNVSAFTNKVDNNGGTFRYYPDGSTLNTRQAVVQPSPIVTPLYLGLKNPSMMDGIAVTLEVVALVKKEVYEDKWTSESIDVLYKNCIQNFRLQSKETEQICNCYRTKAVAKYTPSKYASSSEAELNQFHEELVNECAKSTANQQFLIKENKVKDLLELVQGQNVIKDYVELEKSFLTLISLGFNSYEVYCSLGFYQLCLKKFDEAKQSLTRGLGKKPDNLFLLGNLGNYYLLTNQYNQALEIYKAHLNEKLTDSKTFKDAISEDIKEFEKLGISNPDFDILKRDLGLKG